MKRLLAVLLVFTVAGTWHAPAWGSDRDFGQAIKAQLGPAQRLAPER